jgi:predicted glycosyltransferase
MGIWNGCPDVSCYTWSQHACAVYLVEQEVVIYSTSAEYAVWEKIVDENSVKIILHQQCYLKQCAV